jgi:hypothetical protein
LPERTQHAPSDLGDLAAPERGEREHFVDAVVELRR